MAIEQLSSAAIEQLVGQRHGLAGFEYPENGLQPYYQWLMRTIHALGESSAGWLKVHGDDGGDTSVSVMPGRVTIDGQVYDYGGETLDLASYNNDTVYIWLVESGGSAVAVAGSDAGGWPNEGHLKLAEVTVGGGVIGAIVDRRSERFLTAGPMPELIGKLPWYNIIVTPGDTVDPTELVIQLTDITGSAIVEADWLRVRICDLDSYDFATNATISPVGSYTQTQQAITAGKDLVIECTQGFFELIVTNATAETVTLRFGPAEIGPRRCDYSQTLDITHS